MSSRWIITLLGCSVACSSAAIARGASRESPKFTGDAMPTPPQQRAAWKPPEESKLSEKFISATALLFEHGMADPRGLEYRQVELATGDVWGGDGGVVKTHAWVFPAADSAKAGANARFAVAWNGLVYPTVSVGDPADLKADVTALCEADEQMRAKYAKENGANAFYRFRHALPEGSSISHETMTATRACMVLRLGETALAERLWADWTSGMKESTNDDAAHLADPYLMLATEWIWARFDRAVCAHMRGDDRLALLDARALGAIQKSIDAAATKRGFELRDNGGDNRETTHFDFLEPVPRLLADQERRAKAPPRKSALAAGAKGFKTKAEYIAALIADLDDVAARQGGQPGGVSLGDGPAVQELIKQGDVAVEPLIQCLEQDTRLTRSVHFWRDFSYHRSLLGVHEAAYVAISAILKESFFGIAATGDDLSGRGMEGRRAVAERIRTHWAKYKGVPIVERWYQALADDQAGPAKWAQAAANISQPVDVEVGAGGWVSVPNRKPGEKPPLHGEPLRRKKDPSVSELLAKRLRQLIADAPGDNGFGAWQNASMLAPALADWDGKAHLDDLRAYTAGLQKQLVANAHGQGYWFVMRICQMFTARQKAGDPSVIDDYIAWLKSVPRSKSDSGANLLFEQMWRNPDHPGIKATAEALFNGEHAEWNPVLRTTSGGYRDADLLRSPLLGMPEFRRQIVRMLADRSPAGVVTLGDAGSQSINVTGGWQSGTGYCPDDPGAPPPGTKVNFRVCDLWAQHVGWAEGTPRLELYWAEEKRDAAIKKLIEFLDRYGDRFRYNADDPETWIVPNSPTRMSFPRLDRPATPADVKAGRAIFSLAGDAGSAPAEVRLVPLPQRPLSAEWATLKAHPRQTTQVDQSGKTTHFTTYDNAGYIWQAEEVRIGNRWQRYYGFVGHYDVARVPAEEIDVSGGGFYEPLTNGLGAVIYPPGVDENGAITNPLPTAADPLLVTLMIRNRTGLDQTTLARFTLPRPDGKLLLAPGIRLRVFVSQGSIGKPDGSRIFSSYDTREDWKELPAKERASGKGDFGSQKLLIGQQFTAFRVDLRDWFDLSQPADYEVQIEMDEKQGAPATGLLRRMAFPVMPKTSR
jgi:hypothetical protein